MHLLIALFWLTAPLAPLNPTAQDTLPVSALHASLGIGAGNGVISPGPEFSLKYELLAMHPVVVRGSIDFRVGTANTRIWPTDEQDISLVVHGPFQAVALGVDAFYYRGTNRLMAYLGLGVIYGFERYNANSASASYLLEQYGIDDVAMRRQFGYRLLMGLRIHRAYSLEIAVTELRPDVVFSGRQSGNQYFNGASQTRLGSFSLSLGRIWTIRQL